MKMPPVYYKLKEIYESNEDPAPRFILELVSGKGLECQGVTRLDPVIPSTVYVEVVDFPGGNHRSFHLEEIADVRMGDSS